MTSVSAIPLRPASTLRGGLEMPSDKSISHRALICAALASGHSRISFRQAGADVLSTLDALQSLGVTAQSTAVGNELVVWIPGYGFDKPGRTLPSRPLSGGLADCGNSGTSMRLLAGALSAGTGAATLIGDESLSRRPMVRIAAPLRAMGAEIDLVDGHAPVVIRGLRPLRAIDYRLPIASAQVVGAIALAALSADGITTLTVPGVVRDHTERMLSAQGATIERTTDSAGTTIEILGPSELYSMFIDVPGDFSSAAAWIVAGALHADADVELFGVGLNPTRTALVDVLREMGAKIKSFVLDSVAGEPVGRIEVQGGSTLNAVRIGPSQIPQLIDELPLLAVAMAAADGVSEVRGASELRVKETDRIAAMCAALSAAGAQVEELPDGWRISRGKPRDAQVTTHGDHRIAMAMAVAAWSGVASSVMLDDPDCVAVSYPSFWDDARRVGAIA